MIRIDWNKKLRKIGLSKNQFEGIYVNKLLDHQHSIVSESKNNILSDRFGLNINPIQLVQQKNEKMKLESIFFQLYNNNLDLKNFIRDLFRDINSIAESRELLREIILFSPEDLKSTASAIDAYLLSHPKSTLKLIFNYSRDNTSRIRPIFKKVEFKVCIYCNRNYTSNFSSKRQKKATFTLDHFYQKDKYPILSLSLYNLIPSCAVCNTNIKNTRDVEHYENPHSQLYDFHNKAKFKIMPNHRALLTTSDSSCRQYIKDFYINEIYETHNGEIEEFIKRRQIFTDVMIKNLARLTNHSENKIKSTLFGDVIFNKSLDSESLAKLRSDLAKELGLT